MESNNNNNNNDGDEAAQVRRAEGDGLAEEKRPSKSKGGGKGKKGSGKGSKGSGKALGNGAGRICYDWQRDGECRFGDQCRFSHGQGPPSKGREKGKKGSWKGNWKGKGKGNGIY